jgi:hypothetical protein
MEPKILSEMGLTEEEIEAVKILEGHYGDINSWEIDHWKNYNEMLDVKAKQWLSEYDLGKDRETVYEKENERLITLGLEAKKLIYLCGKIQHGEDLEQDEKYFLVKKLYDEAEKITDELQKLSDEYLNLNQEYVSLVQDRSANPGTFNRKKPVGRPSSKIIYQWMDYLKSELGSNQKAANYASDFPMIDYRNPASLLREYRKYCNDKGEG